MPGTHAALAFLNFLHSHPPVGVSHFAPRHRADRIRGSLRTWVSAALALSLGVATGLTSAAAHAQVTPPLSPISPISSLPEYPAITGFEDPNGLVPPASAVTIFDSDYTADYIPAIRTSSDGRVAMSYIGVGQERLRFQLFRPEAHLAAMEAAGGPVDPNTSGFMSGFADLYVVDPGQGVDIVGEGRFRHMALCDGSSLMAGETANPQVCEDDGNLNDCYELFAVVSVMGPESEPSRVDLYRVPVRVEVARPKTATAEIVALTAEWNAASTQPALTIDGTKSFFEPVFDRTGKLFVGRVGGAPNLAHANESIDIVYGVAPAGQNVPACDPATWVEGLKPISHAHHDPEMWIGPVYTGTPRFGIAAYPIRDAEGNTIADGDDVMATYPWMDREGNNLFFTTVHATIHWQDTGQPDIVQTRYPTRGATFPLMGSLLSLSFTDPVDRAAFDVIAPLKLAEVGLWSWLYQFEQDSEKRGAATAGLWTQGKMVVVDNRLTLTDYGMRPEDPIHREIFLYQPRTDADGSGDGYARVGSGTASGWSGALANPNFGWYPPPNYPGNPAVIDSLENLFVHHGILTSYRPRDVVWSVGDGDAIADVAFDDWINPDAFIVSSMLATVTFEGPEPQLANVNRMTYNDGFVETNTLFRGRGWGGEIRLQNAATTLPERWHVPSHGLGNGVRVEPIARGGAEGRGLWLDGAGAVTYEVDIQPQNTASATWYFGVHVDARFADDGVARTVMTFPDGSHVALGGLSAIHIRRANGENVHTVEIPPELRIASRAWSHLGLRVEPGGRAFEVLLDGYPLDRWQCPTLLPKPKKRRINTRLMIARVEAQKLACPALFSMQPGPFTLGAAGPDPAFRGWVDDLRVFAAEPGDEVACNHARGTLVRVTGQAEAGLAARAAAYPAWAHAELGQRLGESGSSYLCFRESDPSTTSLASLPTGTDSVRTALVFPESAEFAAGSPRPDSSANSFCQTCHTTESALGLGLAALAPNGINLENDLRRQPSQPPMRVGGVIPADWLAPGVPAALIQAPSEGYPMDLLLHSPPGP